MPADKPLSTIGLFNAADDAYRAELRRLFGREAARAFNQNRGKGEPGSELNRLWLARRRAADIFNRMMRRRSVRLRVSSPDQPNEESSQ